MGNILSNNKPVIPENQLIIIELLKTKLNELEISNKQLTEQFIVERTKYQRQVKKLENKLGQLESNGKINVNVEDINKSVDRFLADETKNQRLIPDYLEKQFYRNILNLTVELLSTENQTASLVSEK